MGCGLSGLYNVYTWPSRPQLELRYEVAIRVAMKSRAMKSLCTYENFYKVFFKTRAGLQVIERAGLWQRVPRPRTAHVKISFCLLVCERLMSRQVNFQAETP